LKGRHQALQFVPNKRARRGIKVYKLCSSLGPEAGYTTAFRIYMGKDRGDVPASMKAVIDLLEGASWTRGTKYILTTGTRPLVCSTTYKKEKQALLVRSEATGSRCRQTCRQKGEEV